MFKHKRIFIPIIFLLVFLSGYIGSVVGYNMPHTTAAAAAPAVQTPSVYELWQLTNAERQKAGVKPLALDPRLDSSAQKKADEISATGVFEHAGSTGVHGMSYIPATELKCTYISENLGEGMTSKQTIDGLMSSKPHHDAILDARYDLIGFGISRGSNYYEIVQHFCDLSN